MQLTYEYSYDPRMHATIFRYYGGAAHLKTERMRALLWQVLWVGLLLVAVLLALQSRSWLLVATFLAAAVWKSVYLVATARTGRIATFALRETFRGKPRDKIALVVTEEGLRENSSGVESIAPWSSVRSHFYFRRLLAIELSNKLWAYIPTWSLSPSSSSIELLLQALRERGVPVHAAVAK